MSNPAGISGSGNSITFNPNALTAGEYTVTTRSGIVSSYTDMCIVRVVKVVGLNHQIGATTVWKCFNKPQKILYGKDSRVRAITVPDTERCASSVLWEGTYGVQGVGLQKSHVYNGAPSASDIDLKSVATNCGPDPDENFLVCPFVVGIHSDAGSGNDFSDKHAWLTITTFSGASPLTVSMGLWGNKPKEANGSDVHIGLEPAAGRYNRYFLMAPSQAQALVQFVNTKCEWSYFYTCANWAEDGYRIASGETISSRDYVVFGTPRAIGISIESAESVSPTQLDIPYDGGEDAISSSSSSSDGAESSFP